MPPSLFHRLSASARRASGVLSEDSLGSRGGSERSSPTHSLQGSRRSPSIPIEVAPPRNEEAFEVIARNPTETIAIAGDCLIVVIGRTMSASGVHAVQRGLEQLRARYGRFGYLSVIEDYRLGELEPKARDLMGEVIGKYSRDMAVAAFAVAGVGFRATAVRSILTAVHVASRAKHPMKVFPQLVSALEWYAAMYPEHRCDIATLARTVEALGPPGAARRAR